MNKTAKTPSIQDKCIFVASFPRSGTHLTIDLLRKQFKECQVKLSILESRHRSYLTLGHLSRRNPNYISQAKALAILGRVEVPIIKTHETPGFREIGKENEYFVQQLSQKAIFFYVVRDVREVLTSLHCGLQSNSLEARCSFSKFIRQEREGQSWPKRWANHVQMWTSQPFVELVKYEEIIRNPAQTIEDWGKLLELEPKFEKPLLPSKCSPKNRWQDYWFRFTGKIESTAIDSFFSHHKSSWKTLLDYQDRCFLHQEAGNVLIDLGYEVDNSWISE